MTVLTTNIRIIVDNINKFKISLSICALLFIIGLSNAHGQTTINQTTSDKCDERFSKNKPDNPQTWVNETAMNIWSKELCKRIVKQIENKFDSLIYNATGLHFNFNTNYSKEYRNLVFNKTLDYYCDFDNDRPDWVRLNETTCEKYGK